MDEQTVERVEELWEILLELTGDLIALESFCLSEDRCAADFTPATCAAYLRRVGDGIEQRLKALQQLIGVLMETSRKRLGA